MNVLSVIGIAAMCFLLYKIKEVLELLNERVSRIEEHVAD